MRLEALRRVSLLALTAVVAPAACSREHGAVAPSFERMLVQPRYEPYGASDFFPDGRAMRIPPNGTVSRERLADSALIPSGMAGEDSGTVMPLRPSAELLATGQSRFGIYCAVCHGVLGDGRSIVARNMVECPPPSLLSATIRALPPATLYQVIGDGFGRMPPYAAELSVQERWAVVAYVRQLQSRAPPDGTATLRGPGCGSRL